MITIRNKMSKGQMLKDSENQNWGYNFQTIKTRLIRLMSKMTQQEKKVLKVRNNRNKQLQKKK